MRLVPSAANGQPWRIYKEADKNIFHFYQKGGWLLDMGIAMANFELVALENGLTGNWVNQESRNDSQGMKYRISWIGQ